MGTLLALAAATALSTPSEPLRALAERAAGLAMAKGLKAEEVGVSVAVLHREGKPAETGDFGGDQAMYPASVVKLFFLAYAEHLLDRREIVATEEFRRARHDMIVDSNNDATGLVLDTITGTTGGPELSPRELRRWMDRRQKPNRWFRGLGYLGVNACQKTWNEGPYGRERQGYGPKFELRNSLTPNACVRLMSEIALDRIVNPTRCAEMRDLLSRKNPKDDPSADAQSKNYSGGVLPSGYQLWSKAGWTDTVRHDVAYVKAPDGREFVWAIFTRGHSNQLDVIPTVAAELLRSLSL